MTDFTKKQLTPDEMFKSLKDQKETVTDELLTQVYDNALYLASKYKAAGQVAALKKIVYIVETIEKERELIKLGINTFIYKDAIDYYIDMPSDDRPVKIIELANYQREIPDEIVETIENVKDIFDELYVVYTDYTSKDDRRIAAEKRSTDPIIFGVFMNKQARVCVDRFYFLGDWEDEYCDLTLDKMLSTIKSKTGKDANRKLYTPVSVDELRDYIELHSSNSSLSTLSVPIFSTEQADNKPRSFFSKVRTFFGFKK